MEEQPGQPKQCYTNGLILEGEYHCAPMAILRILAELVESYGKCMGQLRKMGKKRYGALCFHS